MIDNDFSGNFNLKNINKKENKMPEIVTNVPADSWDSNNRNIPFIFPASNSAEFPVNAVGIDRIDANTKIKRGTLG